MISPQATADIYQAVSALADRGIEVRTGDGGTYEHVDLVFANGGPFDPAKPTAATLRRRSRCARRS